MKTIKYENEDGVELDMIIDVTLEDVIKEKQHWENMIKVMESLNPKDFTDKFYPNQNNVTAECMEYRKTNGINETNKLIKKLNAKINKMKKGEKQ